LNLVKSGKTLLKCPLTGQTVEVRSWSHDTGSWVPPSGSFRHRSDQQGCLWTRWGSFAVQSSGMWGQGPVRRT